MLGMDGIEKLIVCSQVFYDKRISELKNEVETLKVKLFWATFGCYLQFFIMQHGRVIGCTCVDCTIYSRNNSLVWDGEEECKWQPIFEEIVRGCGLTIAPLIRKVLSIMI